MNIKKLYIFFLVFSCIFILFPKISLSLSKLTYPDIVNNAVDNRRLVIAGENVSFRKASRIAAEEYAYVWYSLSKSFLSKMHKLSLLERVEDTSDITQLIEYLKAIKESGVHWDIILTRKGRSTFYKVLKKMNDKDFNGSDISVIFRNNVKKSKKLFAQIKRVYGENVKIILRYE